MRDADLAITSPRGRPRPRPPPPLAHRRRARPRRLSGRHRRRHRRAGLRRNTPLHRAVRHHRAARPALADARRDAAPLAACVPCAARRYHAAGRAAKRTPRANRPAAASTRAGARGRPRPRIAPAPGRRCGAGKDDSGGPGPVRASLRDGGRARADPHAGRAARAVGGRARATIRHRCDGRGRPRRAAPAGDAARRRQPLVDDRGRDRVDRLREAAGDSRRGRLLPMGRVDRRRGARRRERQRASCRGRRPCGPRRVRSSAHRHAAQRRPSGVSVVVRPRGARRSAAAFRRSRDDVRLGARNGASNDCS